MKKKTRVKMNKPLYLGMSILDISKMLMYKFWYDYFKPKYVDRAKLCYTDALLFALKPKIFFEDISNDVEKWFDTSNHDKNDKRPLPTEKNKKVPGLFKDELGGNIITEFVALRPKAHSYLDGDVKDHKKAKGTIKCIIKQKLFHIEYLYRIIYMDIYPFRILIIGGSGSEKNKFIIKFNRKPTRH